MKSGSITSRLKPKQQWMEVGGSASKVKSNASALVFMEMQRDRFDSLYKGTVIIGEHCVKFLDQLDGKINDTRLGLQEKIINHRNTASVHKGTLVIRRLASIGVVVDSVTNMNYFNRGRNRSSLELTLTSFFEHNTLYI